MDAKVRDRQSKYQIVEQGLQIFKNRTNRKEYIVKIFFSIKKIPLRFLLKSALFFFIYFCLC